MEEEVISPVAEQPEVVAEVTAKEVVAEQPVAEEVTE